MSRIITRLMDKLVNASAKENPEAAMLIVHSTVTPDFTDGTLRINGGDRICGSCASIAAAMGIAMALFSMGDQAPHKEGFDQVDADMSIEGMGIIFIKSLKMALKRFGIDPTENKLLRMIAAMLTVETAKMTKEGVDRINGPYTSLAATTEDNDNDCDN